MKKIALYTFFDDNFFEYGFTMIHSFLITNKWFNGDIFILSDNGENCSLSENNINLLKKLYKNTYQYKIDIDVYNPIFKNFLKVDRKEFKASFYKIEMFKKDDYDFKMYIDADVCFNGNIEELFSVNYKSAFALMCRDRVCTNYLEKEVALKTDNDYANMGFLFIDGSKLNEGDYDKIINGCSSIKNTDYKNKHTFRGVYGDQDCLNEFIKNTIIVPAVIYDAPADCINSDNIKEVKIIHYYGATQKPWSCNRDMFAFQPWYKNYFLAMKRLKEIR